MRRAEKAGRDDASAQLLESDLRKVTVERLSEGESPIEAVINALGREKAAKYIGAHQLTGRAFQSALEAYDRGYRARLAEVLATLTEKKEGTS